MEKLKIVLVGVVLLLAATVAYGLIDGGGDGGAETGATVAEAPPEAPPASTQETTPVPQGGADQAGGAERGGDGAGTRAGKGPGGSAADDGGGNGGGGAKASDGAQAPPAGASAPGAAAGRAEFVKRANRICATLPKRFAQRAAQVKREEGGTEPEPADMIRRVAAPVLFEAAGDLDRLTPPAGGEDGAEALVAALRNVAKTARSAPSPELLADDSSLAEFAKLARGLDVDACGQL